MTQRLQKILSARGVASRRKAEEMILAGRVSCNGRICDLGDSADPDVDEILVDGKPLPRESGFVYLMLHKPRGYVTTLSDEKGRKNAAMLVADCGTRVYPVGRLDMDSEGLLIFTNDGELANRLMHPRHEVGKTYRVTVKGFQDGTLDRFAQSMVLDGYVLRPAQVKKVWSSEDSGKVGLEITIHEGRNRQVRRMCAIAGLEVTRLVRIREGEVALGDLPSGAWRYLTDAEVASLRK